MLPIAQTACSLTFWLDEDNSSTKRGRAPVKRRNGLIELPYPLYNQSYGLSASVVIQFLPSLTTIQVCSEVPDAMLVKAHAASNCISGLVSTKNTSSFSFLKKTEIANPKWLSTAPTYHSALNTLSTWVQVQLCKRQTDVYFIFRCLFSL